MLLGGRRKAASGIFGDDNPASGVAAPDIAVIRSATPDIASPNIPTGCVRVFAGDIRTAIIAAVARPVHRITHSTPARPGWTN